MMDFYECGEKINKLNAKIAQLTSKANDSYNNAKIKACANAVEKALHMCESQLICFRELYFSLYSPKSEEARSLNANAAVNLGVSIEQLPFSFRSYRITLPFLLPNQRFHWQGFRDTIGVALHFALDDFCSKENVSPLKSCSIILTSFLNYDENKYAADNDNKEAKDILNILSKNLIIDDNGQLCDIMYRTVLTDKYTKTEIIVTEKEHFIEAYTYSQR